MNKSTLLALASAAFALTGAVVTPLAHAGGDARQWLNDMTYPSQNSAPAYGPAKTRAEVQAELAEAIRSGNITVGDGGKRLNEMVPSNYPSVTVAPTLTRAQVKAELAEAVRNGEIYAAESEIALKDLYPQRYQHALVKSKTSIQ